MIACVDNSICQGVFQIKITKETAVRQVGKFYLALQTHLH
jgi:hypothetical protein